MSKKKQQKFLQYYEPVHNQFERFCRARVYGGMEYRDLMNETLLIAFEKFDQIKSKTAFLSFLIGTSVKLLANNNRKKKEDLLFNHETVNLYPDLGKNTDHDAEIFLLYKALSKLPDQQKECIVLFEITGYSIKEIAGIQKSSESAIKQRLKRGREKLATILNVSVQPKKDVTNG